ncbi:MAG: ATP synthase F0 subunit B [Thermodesulfobacteriota bacterium]
MNRVQVAKPWAVRILLAVGFCLGLAGVAGASEAGHGGVSPAMVTDLIWRTVNFLIFAAILVKLVSRPAKEFFAKRSQDIALSLKDLEEQKAAAAQALKEAEAQLAQVAAEREKIIRQYQAEGEAEKAKILEKAEMVAARIKEMAALTIEQESKKAAQELKQEAVAKATQMAEDLLKKKITHADHERLVEDYLHKVVEKH